MFYNVLRFFGNAAFFIRWNNPNLRASASIDTAFSTAFQAVIFVFA